jgi:CTP:phosphocholine cytidylyltransferase-like protein/thiamine kinase-like enzyme
MIERQIEQLINKGITEIIIVVGYKKENFDYLIDKYGVKLIYNPEYAVKNNFVSLYHARQYLHNSYLLMSDHWIEDNIFNKYEPRSWFSCLYIDGETSEWCAAPAVSGRIESVSIGGKDAFAMVGPAYITSSFSKELKKYLSDYYTRPGTDDYCWEQILKDNIKSLPIYINEQTGNVYEFENVDDLKKFDPLYDESSNNRITTRISDFLNVPKESICDLYAIKEGVTNSSFHFSVGCESFVYRIPGSNIEKFIDRNNELIVYESIKNSSISDEIVHLDINTGIKISRFLKNARISNPYDDNDLENSMKQLRLIHNLEVTSVKPYNIDKMINYYFTLAEGLNAIYFSDIDEIHTKLRELLDIRKSLDEPNVLCHGDFVHTNVLFIPDGSCKIIDWEYGGMSDPVMDVAMYSIYAGFDKERIDTVLQMYMGRNAHKHETLRMYLYVALSGFLWCMWSQYKQAVTCEFGEYPLKMYRYMKDYYKHVKTLT